MDLENAEPNLIQSKTELFLNALGGAAVETQCTKCHALEWVIPLDLELDDAFLANYLCDECDTPILSGGQQTAIE